MGLEGPGGQGTGQEHDPAPSGTPFDLGDSRDLAAAVRAAWASEPVSLARPSPEDRPRQVAEADPLAHLRGEVKGKNLHPRFPRPTMRRSTFLASLGVAAAIMAVAALPMVSGGTPRPGSVVNQRARPTTSTTVRPASTTAFTYPPETLAPADTVAPAAVSPPAPSAARPAPDKSAPTATTARPRTTTTARRAAKPTTTAPAPTTTTTQAPPPPPDDGGGSSDPEPPPYP